MSTHPAAQEFSGMETPLPHPGEILREDYLAPLSMSPGALARAMKLKDRTRVERLVRELQPVTPDTAMRLGRVFRTSPQFWMNLQAQHDLSKVAIERGVELDSIQPLEIQA